MASNSNMPAEPQTPTPQDGAGVIADPSTFWRLRMALQGMNWKAFTHEDVPSRDLSSKWIIVTGANSGVGREAALSFARCGANLILACRDNPPAHEKHPEDVVAECMAASKSSGYEGSVVEWWKVDMTNLSSVHALIDRWLQRDTPLDILCNNAGIGDNAGDGQGGILKTEDGFEIVHQVNFLTYCLLTLRLLPSLARANSARVICTSSCMMYFGTMDVDKFNGQGCKGEDFYCNNKLFLQVWLTELQHRLPTWKKYDCSNIVIHGVHPGYVNTGMWNVAQEGGGWLTRVRSRLAALSVQLPASYFAISAEQGAYAIVHAATSLGCAENGGRYFNRIWETEAMPYCQDPTSRLLVWNKVMEELDLASE